jgi:probable phosphomutase (TIGR03848 family)
MTNIVLLRHGLTAMTGPRLAGWTPGISLDERGVAQARKVAERLSALPLAAIVSSPLERCRETAAAVAEGRELSVAVDERIGECKYGDWTGQELKVLAKDPLWKVVQNNPSAVVFPGPEGEALRDTQVRAVTALREWDAKIAAEAGPDATWLACSHGDVIKAVVADALGMHLDLFQRINVDPCSVTVIRYAELRSFALRVNDNGGSIDDLLPPKKKGRVRRKASSDAVVGGGAGVSTR